MSVIFKKIEAFPKDEVMDLIASNVTTIMITGSILVFISFTARLACICYIKNLPASDHCML